MVILQTFRPKAELDIDLSEGKIFEANILLDNFIKIRTDELTFKNGNIDHAAGIRSVTSCEECENKKPNWYLTASKAKRDLDNRDVIYQDLTVRVKGLPVAYIPYVRLPDPSVKRAKGFLVPQAVITSNLGAGAKLPYFIPIGKSRDILLTPYIAPKTRTLEYRYREVLYNGDFSISGALSNDETFQNKLRFFYKAFGNFKLRHGVNLGFNFGQVSDNSFLGDYSYSEKSELQSKVTLDKMLVSGSRFFEGSLRYVRDRGDGVALSEYYSLDGNYLKRFDQNILPGNFYLNTRINSSLNINVDNSFSRPPSLAQIGILHSNKSITRNVAIKNSSYLLFNSFVNAKNNDSTNENLIFQYGTSTQLYLPLIKKIRDRYISFSPWVSFSLNGQKGETAGDFFIGGDELSFGSIMSDKKYTSLSETEKGLSTSFGIDYEVDFGSDNRLAVSFGGFDLVAQPITKKLIAD